MISVPIFKWFTDMLHSRGKGNWPAKSSPPGYGPHCLIYRQVPEFYRHDVKKGHGYESWNIGFKPKSNGPLQHFVIDIDLLKHFYKDFRIKDYIWCRPND